MMLSNGGPAGIDKACVHTLLACDTSGHFGHGKRLKLPNFHDLAELERKRLAFIDKWNEEA